MIGHEVGVGRWVSKIVGEMKLVFHESHSLHGFFNF